MKTKMHRICLTCQVRHGATFNFYTWRKLIQHMLLHLIGMADELCDVRKTNLLLFDGLRENNTIREKLQEALEEIAFETTCAWSKTVAKTALEN